MGRVEYDEFGLLHDNVAEFDLQIDELPPVERRAHALPDGRRISALCWGGRSPRIVFLHGGAQNAHTWDTVILALGEAAVAIDLPGHGHSDWRVDGTYTPDRLADDIAPAVSSLAPEAELVVGMSLGGLTAMELAVRHPALVPRLMMVDITPGVNQRKAKAVIDFVDGPQSFPSFDDLLARTIEHHPTRSESSLRRGILHNARQLDDGSWRWRYDRAGHAHRDPDADVADRADDPDAEVADPADSTGSVGGPGGELHGDGVTQRDGTERRSPLWDDFGAVGCPLVLVRGSVSPVVDDEDLVEARRRRPALEVHVVDGAGHSVQGDRPLELAALLASQLR